MDSVSDDDSSVSSSSTIQSNRFSASVNEEVHVEKESLLDQALDALYEKRYSYIPVVLSFIPVCGGFLLMVSFIYTICSSILFDYLI